MAKGETCVLTNMCMIYDGNGNVLVQDKINPDWPGMTFPGGHVEYGESFVLSVIREIKEETGLDIQNPVLCGVKQFLKLDGARYIVFLYKTNQFSGELRGSGEGAVFWIPFADFDRYTWVPDFEDMLSVFLNDKVGELYYYRENGELKHEFF